MGPDDTPLLLDVMLGKLATYLRMCGYDAVYALDRNVERDDRLLEIATEDGRLLLTRDIELASRGERSLLLETRAVTDQLRELLAAGFDLSLDEPERCAKCNGALEPVATGASTPEYAPATTEQPVWRCPNCEQYFWTGSHWRRVEDTLASL